MVLVGKMTLTDTATLEHLATIVIGVCDDETEELSKLRVILSVEDDDHWRRKKVRYYHKAVLPI